MGDRSLGKITLSLHTSARDYDFSNRLPEKAADEVLGMKEALTAVSGGVALCVLLS